MQYNLNWKLTDLQQNKNLNTVTSTGNDYRAFDKLECSEEDYIRRQTFPLDYNFQKAGVKYVCGMSVPPIMMAQIINQILKQWNI